MLKFLERIGSAGRQLMFFHSRPWILESVSATPVSSGYHTSARCDARKKVPWEYDRPVRIPAIFTSGDKEVNKIDKTTVQSKFRGSKELENADDNVRKMCSLEFATKAEVRSELKREYLERVARHSLDLGSLESKIAKLTERIRSLQEHVRSRTSDSIGKVKLKHAVDRRNKLYGHLRQSDYERFEFVLDKLNLEYKRPARFYWYQTRKGYIRDMTQKYCDDVRIAKLQALKDEYKSQQEAFLKEKAEKMKFIAEEEIALGLRSPDEPSGMADELDMTTPKPPPVEGTLLCIARTAEGKMVYSVPTWPPRKDD